ncbi:hypothetical protein [Paenibacillus physcomitrellae]|uniref:Uncharacterized protein n=1 Tax=Paenibacillus physcomitrellae TaxID=1619311 RepID=A0ABQ1GBK7_9BACL|nr:hypothetical protein [Paenibacillus physcomitrellae]GGA40523.1 hypothetical protein GCM10010917_27190 [Paenibacillus physcomitrellae]
MKRLVFILLGVILITNIIWGIVYNEKNSKSSKSVVHVYTLNGKGELWDISDYKIIVTEDKILRGNGKLTYKGAPKNIENSTYYKYDFKEMNSTEKYETVYTHEASSSGGPVAILENLDNDTGSITGDYSYNELLKDKQNYESTTLTITWNDNNKELHTETIDLDIDSEIAIDNN